MAVGIAEDGPCKEVAIYFGSQSGTAESFAEEVSEEATGHGMLCDVMDLQNFTPEKFASHKIVVLVVATYGEGEPTDNATDFNSWASDPRRDGALKGQRFCVMGLGDRNYSQFCNMGVTTDASLERLGGTRIYKKGMGDDCQDIVSDFNDWKSGGLYAALKAAIAEVREEGGFAVANASQMGGAVAAKAAVVLDSPPDIHVFYGCDDNESGAKGVCDSLIAACKAKGLSVPLVQSCAERKTFECVRKLPRRAVALVIADTKADGLCNSGKKLIRNMRLELDVGVLNNKGNRLVVLTVGRSNGDIATLKETAAKNVKQFVDEFDRAGCESATDKLRSFADLGTESIESIVEETCGALELLVAAAPKAAGAAAPAAPAATANAGQPASAPVAHTEFLHAGAAAQEASEVLMSAWGGGGVSAEEIGLAQLAGAATRRSHLVIVAQCGADGELSDEARGLAARISAAPLPVKMQLRQLRFALVAAAESDYGNAGERASSIGGIGQMTQAVAPILEAMKKCGSICVSSSVLDLQNTDESGLAAVRDAIRTSFDGGVLGTPVPPNTVLPAAAPATPSPSVPAQAPAGSGKIAALRMAAAAKDLPSETAGEPSDVVARFYFEAARAKILKVQELREKPCPEDGLATVEIEIAAAGALQGYSLGGTLSLLPENDPADVAAILALLGLSQADLAKAITFVDESGRAVAKRPFPTPCTLGEALGRYCDLARAPTKKMLAALQPQLKDPAAADRIAKLLENKDALSLLHSAPLCCKMHEFFGMVGITRVEPVDFLQSCPRQKAREFTIASSPKATPEKITLCVSLTSHSLPDLSEVVRRFAECGAVPSGFSPPSRSKRQFFGLCSHWLTTRIKKGDEILAKQRHSPLKLPEKDVPIVMVGAGAGVAPFRGFWEQMKRESREAPAALFFGCRHPDKDWIYKTEMNQAVKIRAGFGRPAAGPRRPLACLFPAFSRPEEIGKEGEYVQHLLKKQGPSVKHWMQTMNGTFYLCGSSSMGNAVLAELAEILDGGKERVDALRQEGRIIAEMWG